jgi:hypothetical protein
LGDEQPCFIEGSPSDWDLLPLPDGAFKVAQFIAVCRRSKVVSISPGRHRRDFRLCRR